MAQVWQVATLTEAHMVAVDVKALTFTVSPWLEHKAGQHYDIRLTAEGGYMAERSYSLASPPEQKGEVEFGIQILANGEVSPYLFALQAGEQVEIRGPIGGHFVWDVAMPGPLVLIGGGSGMVPLMSMLRHWKNHATENSERAIVFLISARTLEHVLYQSELQEVSKKFSNVEIVMTITDGAPENWTGPSANALRVNYTRRVDMSLLQEVFGHLIGQMPMIYVCGPTPFVEVVANNLVQMGFNSHEIRTERFGG